MTAFTHSIRQLILRPSFSAIVVTMLALGIGGATAIFALFHEVLVQPLPVPEPDRLFNVVRAGSEPGAQGEAVSYAMFRALEAGQQVFTHFAGHTPFVANLQYGDEAFGVAGVFVSGGYFETLGLAPKVGRLIGKHDEPQIGESPVVVLSHEFWLSRFGGDPDIVGRTLTVNGAPLTIIGVAPERFSGTQLAAPTHIFVPLTMRWRLAASDPDTPENRRFQTVQLFGHLASEMSADQAAAGLNTLYGGILQEVEAPLRASEDERRPLLSQRLELVSGARGQGHIPGADRSLTLLLGGTLLVLLIVCVNVANLLLVRGASRASEMAIRESLGASRPRLVGQLLVESAALAMIGGLLALPVAALTLSAAASFLPTSLAEAFTMRITSSTILFASAATVGAAILCGLFPALTTASASPAVTLKAQSAQTLGGKTAPRVRAGLAATQIALSMVLLVLAALFTKSLLNVARIDLGVQVDSLITFSISPSVNGYAPEESMVLYRQIEETLAEQPEIVGAASAAVALVSHNEFQAEFPLERADGTIAPVVASFNVVGGSFFQTLSIPVVAGRPFTAADMRGAPHVAIVNETFARRYALGDDPVGMHLNLGERMEVVGVVADTAYSEVKGEIPPQLFLPRGSSTEGNPFAAMMSSPTFYVQTRFDPETLLQSVRGVIARIDPALPVAALGTMRRQVAERIFLDRFITVLSVGIATLATLLAAIGVYGVVAYNVAARTRELALRVALGATPIALRSMVVKQAAMLAALGLSIGLMAALGVGRATEELLFRLTGWDPLALLGSSAVLVAVALAASYFPARRAATTAPAEALRHE